MFLVALHSLYKLSHVQSVQSYEKTTALNNALFNILKMWHIVLAVVFVLLVVLALISQLGLRKKFRKFLRQISGKSTLEANVDSLPSNFDNFVQTVVDKFNSQRVEQDQFAVMFLMSGKDSSVFEFLNKGGITLTNNEKVTWPPDEQIVNYIVARVDRETCPGTSIHSEESLINRAVKLFESYQNTFDSQPSLLILFSWLMPCKHCTSQFIHKVYENPASVATFKPAKIIVVYVCDYKKESSHVAEESRRKLREKGAIVVNVPYDKELPPIGERRNQPSNFTAVRVVQDNRTHSYFIPYAFQPPLTQAPPVRHVVGAEQALSYNGYYPSGYLPTSKPPAQNADSMTGQPQQYPHLQPYCILQPFTQPFLHGQGSSGYNSQAFYDSQITVQQPPVHQQLQSQHPLYPTNYGHVPSLAPYEGQHNFRNQDTARSSAQESTTQGEQLASTGVDTETATKVHRSLTDPNSSVRQRLPGRSLSNTS